MPEPIKPPTRTAIFALRELEHALGWQGYPRTANLATPADFAERVKTARDSAGLADLLCGPAQARAIKKALGKLRTAEKARAIGTPPPRAMPLRDSRGRIMATDHADEKEGS